MDPPTIHFIKWVFWEIMPPSSNFFFQCLHLFTTKSFPHSTLVFIYEDALTHKDRKSKDSAIGRRRWVWTHEIWYMTNSASGAHFFQNTLWTCSTLCCTIRSSVFTNESIYSPSNRMLELYNLTPSMPV